MYVCGMHVCMHVGSFVNVHVKGWNGMEKDGMKWHDMKWNVCACTWACACACISRCVYSVCVWVCICIAYAFFQMYTVYVCVCVSVCECECACVTGVQLYVLCVLCIITVYTVYTVSIVRIVWSVCIVSWVYSVYCMYCLSCVYYICVLYGLCALYVLYVLYVLYIIWLYVLYVFVKLPTHFHFMDSGAPTNWVIFEGTVSNTTWVVTAQLKFFQGSSSCSCTCNGDLRLTMWMRVGGLSPLVNIFRKAGTLTSIETLVHKTPRHAFLDFQASNYCNLRWICTQESIIPGDWSTLKLTGNSHDTFRRLQEGYGRKHTGCAYVALSVFKENHIPFSKS